MRIFFSFLFALSLAACTTVQAPTLSKTVQTAQDELRVLEDLWSLSSAGDEDPDAPQVSLTVQVKDAEGKTGWNLLASGIELFEVTVTLRGDEWSEQTVFTPLDVDNVYVLGNE